MIICNTYNFGNRNRFGITFELPQDPQLYHGTWLNGGACYWVFGRCVGEMQYSACLQDAMILLEPIQKRMSFQCEKAIFEASAEQILQTIDTDIDHEADGIIEENCFGSVGTFDFWMNFRISLDLDIMNESPVFLFEHDDQARLIITKLNREKEILESQSEHMINAGEVQTVLQESFDWLRVRYQQELDLLENSKSDKQPSLSDD